MLKTVHGLFVVPHYVCGFVALVSFWVPLMVRKGGRVHRVAGVTFAVSMLLAALTAFVMAGAVLADAELIHPHRSARSSHIAALFLTYLGVVSVVIVHNGWALVRLKQDLARLQARWRLGLNQAALLGSVGMLVYGLFGGAMLLAAMSPVGFLTANGYRQALKKISDHQKSAWLTEHIGTMITGGIAVHTAFLAGGGTRFLPAWVGALGWWVWLVPTAVGVPLSIAAQRAYAQPKARPQGARPSP